MVFNRYRELSYTELNIEIYWFQTDEGLASSFRIMSACIAVIERESLL